MSTAPRPDLHETLALAMEAYLLGTLTDEQIDAFEDALLRHPDAADHCAEAIQAVAMTREFFRDDEQQHAILKRDEMLEEFYTLLAELLRIEQQAQATVVEIHQPRKPRYANPWAIGLGSLAATIAIAAVLAFAFHGAGPAGPTGLTLQQLDMPAPQPDPTPAPTPVATLTKTHHATWGGVASAAPGRSPSTGDKLHPNTRLTLTAGFAEITTNRGAIVALHAPCQVELLDKNTVRLVHGRLSGRVESTRAKGFTVKLPNHDRIVDLGTAFSVAVDDRRQAEVRVTEGLVMWAAPDDPSNATERKPLLIAEGESASLAEGRPVLSRIVRLMGVDFQHTGARTTERPRPMVGTTQPGFEAFDQTRVADGNSTAFATEAGDISIRLTGLDRDEHNGYFTRLPTPAEDPFPGFDLYNDFVFDNTDGRFTLTLAGPGIVAGQTYDLTFYAYDPGDGTAGSRHGQTQAVAFAGIDSTAGQAGPITYTVGTHPVNADQFKTTATFTADAQGRITIEATDAYDDDEHRIRLNAIEIARRVAPDRDIDN